MDTIKRDGRGIVGQPDSRYKYGIEGGDSMNWQAHMYYFSTDDFIQLNVWTEDYVKDFERMPGYYVRHPNPEQSKYGFASYCAGHMESYESRDQMTGKMGLFAKAQAYGPLWRSLKAHLKFPRCLFWSNNTYEHNTDPKLGRNRWPDFTGPDIWAMYIRGFRAWPFYLFLVLFDFQPFMNALILKFQDRNDVISHVMKVDVANLIYPTPFGWLATKVFKKEEMLRRIYKYWHKRGQLGMYELYKARINQLYR